MQVLCGIPDVNSRYILAAEELEMPVLISANSFWNDKKKEFRSPDKINHLSCGGSTLVLDSGGFVAMKLYGGYRWTTAQYVDFAAQMCPTWWSAMDYCCEPEIAHNPEQVTARVKETVWSLGNCLAHAIRYREYMDIAMPTFILQGWKPADYVECARMIEHHILSDSAYHKHVGQGWPSLIGIGSVCRRNLTGPDGLYQILNAVDKVLPSHVKLHLFGVKSKAVTQLANWNRIASVDSMAWSVEAWRSARKAQVPRTIAHRARTMKDWWVGQRNRVTQCEPSLFPSARLPK